MAKKKATSKFRYARGGGSLEITQSEKGKTTTTRYGVAKDWTPPNDKKSDPYDKRSAKDMTIKPDKKSKGPGPASYKGDPRNQNYGKLFGPEKTLPSGNKGQYKSADAVWKQVGKVGNRKGGSVDVATQDAMDLSTDRGDRWDRRYERKSDINVGHSTEAAIKAERIKSKDYKLADGTVKKSGGLGAAAKSVGKTAGKGLARAARGVAGAALGYPGTAGFIGYEVGSAIYEAKASQILDTIERMAGKKAYDPNDGKKVSRAPRKQGGAMKGF